MAPKKKVAQPTKLVKKAVKKTAKKTVKKEVKVTTTVTQPLVVQEEVHTGRDTWTSIMEDKADTVMKKPRSWAEWADRQLNKNRIK